MAQIKKRQARKGMQSGSSIDERCPLINAPHDGCYCTLTGSQHVEEMIYYCSANFGECEIYRNTIEKIEIIRERNICHG